MMHDLGRRNQYSRDWRAHDRGTYLVLWSGDSSGYNLPPQSDKMAAQEISDRLRPVLVEHISSERQPFMDVYLLKVSKIADECVA